MTRNFNLSELPEVCEHLRVLYTNDNKLFIVNMVTRKVAECDRADEIGYIVCPFCETAYQIREGVYQAVQLNKETGIVTRSSVTISG